MRRIGLLSDTHGYLDAAIFKYFGECDEIWHAGDLGSIEIADRLAEFRPLRAVFGNIDGAEIRSAHPRDQRFNCDGLDVWITHIGGYPGAYDHKVRDRIFRKPPGLFISGHSHILKVMRDKSLGLMHFNPGACGRVGFHNVRTILRFSIDAGKLSGVEAIELGPRSARSSS